MDHPTTIASVCPTLCRLLGIEPPAVCLAPPLELGLAPARVERALVYAADAIGRVFLDYHPDLKKRLTAASDVQVELRAMFPPKTPVCYASMFTGAPPEVHGIRKYERPVLTCDTLFDVLARRDMTAKTGLSRKMGTVPASVRREPLWDCPHFRSEGLSPVFATDRVPSPAAKKAAIVAVEGCSMAIIFQNRPIDYFIEKDDAAVLARTFALVQADRHELIVSYNQEYDDVLHKLGPESPEAVAAARRHVETFVRLWQATEEHWSKHNRALLFAPDHGAHTVTREGRDSDSSVRHSSLVTRTCVGDHGEDIPEDMDVLHFWRVRAAR